MSTVALSGADTVVINNHSFNDLSDGNCVELTFPNDIASVKVGKNGNALFALNEMGKAADVKLRVVRGSTDDQFILGLMASQQNNFAGFTLLQGQFVKKMGDGQGNVLADTYVLGGGIFVKLVPAKDNVEGDTDQDVSIYEMKFSQAVRAIS